MHNSWKYFKFQSVDFPDFTETELKELSRKVPCRVELFHSNVCYGVEKSWPKRQYNRPKFKDLAPWQKQRIHHKMEQNAVYLYNRYVDAERLKKRQKNRTNRALAPYYEERYLRNLFNRIKALGDNEDDRHNMSDSDASLVTVINTQENDSDLPLRSGRRRSKIPAQHSKSTPTRSKSRSLRSTSNINRSKSSAKLSTSSSKRAESVSDDSGTEIDRDSPLIYEDSSSNEDEDEFLSANEDELSPGRNLNQGVPAALSPHEIKSETSSPFVTPNKGMEDLSPIITPNIEQLRQLRSNLFRVDSDDNVAVDRSIAMVIEVENDSILNFSLPKPTRAKRKNDALINLLARADSSSDDSMSLEDLPIVIDERFNDLLSESSITSSVQNINDDIASLRMTATPQIDSNEFIIISSHEVEKLRQNLNNNSEITSSPLSSSYALQNKSNLSKSYSLRNRNP